MAFWVRDPLYLGHSRRKRNPPPPFAALSFPDSNEKGTHLRLALSDFSVVVGKSAKNACFPRTTPNYIDVYLPWFTQVIYIRVDQGKHVYCSDLLSIVTQKRALVFSVSAGISDLLNKCIFPYVSGYGEHLLSIQGNMKTQLL